MCQEFTDMDIKDALFSIPNIKCPGPDGFNSGFFKLTSHKLGTLVREFFTKGIMPSYLSETKLVLIPKVSHPQNASEFRLISCCNVIYKMISKLICKRLKEVLPSLIDQSQGAFIKVRKLLCNVLICQDLARGYQRKISPLDASSKLIFRKHLIPFTGISSRNASHPSNSRKFSQNGY